MKIQQELIEETKFGVNVNVTFVVTMPDLVEKTDDEELVEALEDKYDALRDKILADALMKQVVFKGLLSTEKLNSIWNFWAAFRSYDTSYHTKRHK